MRNIACYHIGRWQLFVHLSGKRRRSGSDVLFELVALNGTAEALNHFLLVYCSHDGFLALLIWPRIFI